MSYILADEKKPMTGIDVHVVTEGGVKGVAKYWDLTGQWIAQDKKLNHGDVVKKWKYANAT